MKYINSIVQFIAGMLILMIPIVLIYWILDILKIPQIKIIYVFLGIFIVPLIKILSNFIGNQVINFYGHQINLMPLFLCMILSLASCLIASSSRLLTKIHNSISVFQAKSKIKIVKIQQEEAEKQAEIRLKENSSGFLVIKKKLQTTSSAYLISSGLSDQDIHNMIMDKINQYKYFEAFIHDVDDESYSLVFSDAANCVVYALNLQDNITELNKSFDKAGITLHLTCGIYSASATSDRDRAFYVASKICNLASDKEVTCSNMVKLLYDKKPDHKYSFTTRGVYDIGEEIEIFVVK